jgi:hypothetical protein
MFSPDIVESEEFITMPISSQALYFHLGMGADDDGFVQPKIIMRGLGANDDDLKVLLAKRFLLAFDGGVVVIKHWLIHNMIRGDRYKPTRFQEEKKLLKVKENKAYTEIDKSGCQIGNQMAAQVRLGKVRLGKVKIEEKEVAVTRKDYSEFNNVKLTDEEYQKLSERLGENNRNILIEELGGYLASTNKRYASHYATLLNWARRKVGEIQKKQTKIL